MHLARVTDVVLVYVVDVVVVVVVVVVYQKFLGDRLSGAAAASEDGSSCCCCNLDGCVFFVFLLFRFRLSTLTPQRTATLGLATTRHKGRQLDFDDMGLLGV